MCVCLWLIYAQWIASIWWNAFWYLKIPILIKFPKRSITNSCSAIKISPSFLQLLWLRSGRFFFLLFDTKTNFKQFSFGAFGFSIARYSFKPIKIHNLFDSIHCNAKFFKHRFNAQIKNSSQQINLHIFASMNLKYTEIVRCMCSICSSAKR